MMKLLEKYYNINYYCAYKLLFFLCSRLLNPLYWLSLLKWDNRYIKWLVSIGKKIEEGGMNKGVDVYISDMALSTPITISCWIFSLVCLACIKIFKVELSSIWEIPFEKYIIILISLLVIIGICAYYVNKIFLFKHDKYRKYFAEFDKKKRYLLYYGIYVVSLFPSLSGGRLSICCLVGGEGGAETNGGDSMPCGISGGKRNNRTGATGYLYRFIKQ